MTATFMEKGIQALSADNGEEYLGFRKHYGDAHRRKVLLWFRQALEELDSEA